MREQIMSTNTNPMSLHSSFGPSSTADVETKPSFFDRWFDRFLDARIAAGERRARQQLKSLSPEMLRGFGLTPDEIAVVRRTGKLPASYWSR